VKWVRLAASRSCWILLSMDTGEYSLSQKNGNK